MADMEKVGDALVKVGGVALAGASETIGGAFLTGFSVASSVIAAAAPVAIPVAAVYGLYKFFKK